MWTSDGSRVLFFVFSSTNSFAHVHYQIPPAPEQIVVDDDNSNIPEQQDQQANQDQQTEQPDQQMDQDQQQDGHTLD